MRSKFLLLPANDGYLPHRRANKFTSVLGQIKKKRQGLHGTSPVSQSKHNSDQKDYRILFIRHFIQNPTPDQKTKMSLAKMSGKTIRQVNRWNYRCRTRKAYQEGRKLPKIFNSGALQHQLTATEREHSILPMSRPMFDRLEATSLYSSVEEIDGDLSYAVSEVDENWEWEDGPKERKTTGETEQKLPLPYSRAAVSHVIIDSSPQFNLPACFTANDPAPFGNPNEAIDVLKFHHLLETATDHPLPRKNAFPFSAHMQLSSYPFFQRQTEEATREIFIKSHVCWKRKACQKEPLPSPPSVDELACNFDKISLRVKKPLLRRSRETSSTPSEEPISPVSLFSNSSSTFSPTSRSTTPEVLSSPLPPTKRARKLSPLPMRMARRIDRSPGSSLVSTPALSRCSSNSSCNSDMWLSPYELTRQQLETVNDKLIRATTSPPDVRS